MGHRRRPKGPRSTWEPKLAYSADRAAPPAAPPLTDTAIPDAVISKALAHVVPEPAAPGRDDAAPDAALPETALPLAARIPPVTVPPVTAAPATRPSPAAAPVAHDGPAGGGDGDGDGDGRVAVAPDRPGLVEIGSTIARYMRGEGEAAVAHMQALSGAGSPAALMHLQMGEVRRAADASLTCWSEVARQATRLVAFR